MTIETTKDGDVTTVVTFGKNCVEQKREQFRPTTQFLLLPKTINGETKMLTTATWEERRYMYQEFNYFNFIGGTNLRWSKWEATKWILESQK